MDAYTDQDDQDREQALKHAELLQSRVIDATICVLGKQLTDVTYNCLDGETDGGDLDNEDFYLGGEVALTFAHRKDKLHLTWDQGAGWLNYFSLRTDSQSYWTKDVLCPYSAKTLSPWEVCIGTDLLDAEIYGSEDTPYAVVFHFTRSRVAVGTACAGLTPIQFGDGDDIFVEEFNPNSDAFRGLKQMWKSSRK